MRRSRDSGRRLFDILSRHLEVEGVDGQTLARCLQYRNLVCGLEALGLPAHAGMVEDLDADRFQVLQ